MANWMDVARATSCRWCKKKIDSGDHVFRKSAGVYLCGDCGLLAENEPVILGPLGQAVQDDLDTLPPEAAKTAIAQSMVKLAAQVDADEVPPREMTLYTKDIRLGYMQLRDLFPAQEADDPTTKAREDRERRMREQSGI
jgi:hypothetical protein